MTRWQPAFLLPMREKKPVPKIDMSKLILSRNYPQDNTRVAMPYIFPFASPQTQNDEKQDIRPIVKDLLKKSNGIEALKKTYYANKALYDNIIDKQIVDSIADIINNNVFSSTMEKYKGSNWSLSMQNKLYERLLMEDGISFAPNDIAMVIGEESNYDKYRRGSFVGKDKKMHLKKYVGPLQLDADSFAKLYKKDTNGISGQEVWQQYADGMRDEEDIVEDIIRYLKLMDSNIKTDRDKMTYGRIKVNQYAPNANLDDIVNDKVWDYNISAGIALGRLNKTLQKGVATYRDVMNSYDKNLNNKDRK